MRSGLVCIFIVDDGMIFVVQNDFKSCTVGLLLKEL